MDKRKSIALIIETALNDPKQKVKVLPFICGAGKSTAISELIMKAIQQNRRMLVVTDRIYQFDHYLHPRDENVRSFIQSHKKKSIFILTADTVQNSLKRSRNRPVLMMTSQRFLSWDMRILDEYLEWDRSNAGRPWIVFDEKPELYFQYLLDAEIINKYDQAIDAVKKTAYISYKDVQEWDPIWQKIRNTIISSLEKRIPADLEQINKYEMVNQDHGSDDSEKGETGREGNLAGRKERHQFDAFIAFLKKYNRYFWKFNRSLDAAAFARALELFDRYSQLYNFWRKDPLRYENYYLVLNSDLDKLRNVDADTVILDGTAQLSADYRQDGLKISSALCRPYDRKLPNLELILADCKATKYEMRKWSKKILPFFIDFMERQSNGKPVCCFSYKDLIKIDTLDKKEDSETENKDNETEYFGNIRGKNDFLNYVVLGQIGVFQRPVSYYLSRFINQNQKYRELLVGREVQQGIMRNMINSRKYNMAMYKDIVADIEQNLMRSKIRNEDCAEEIKYFVFFDFSSNELLKDLLIRRFVNHYGASVTSADANDLLSIDKVLRRKGWSVAKRLLLGMEEMPRGRCFRIDEWLNELGITKRQYDSAKQSSPCIRRTMDSWRTGKRGEYRKP